MDKNPPLGKENGPVTFVAADQGQRGGAGIGHVDADVEKIFEEPEGTEGGAVGLAPEEKVGGAGQRNDEFEERAAEDHQGVSPAVFAAATENAEEWMASFVDHEVDEIGDQKLRAAQHGVEKEQDIERDGD